MAKLIKLENASMFTTAQKITMGMLHNSLLHGTSVLVRVGNEGDMDGAYYTYGIVVGINVGDILTHTYFKYLKPDGTEMIGLGGIYPTDEIRNLYCTMACKWAERSRVLIGEVELTPHVFPEDMEVPYIYVK